MKLTSQKGILCCALLLAVFLCANPMTARLQNAQPEAGFVAYKCEFQPETNSARIRAVLTGSDGQPIPRDFYTVRITATDTGESLASEKFSVTVVPERPPLQMILILDVTDTVPVNQITNAVRENLFPRLGVLDEVSLVAFSEIILPRTQFYTDKNRLYNENIARLDTLPGENRVYNALSEAISQMPFSSNMRQVILLLTDSGRREAEQPSVETLIAEANKTKIQIFSVGFHTQDAPDDAELIALANGTAGYTWIYNTPDATRLSIGTAIGGHLDNFVRTLNSEILVTVDMHGLTPDENRRVTFDMSIDAKNEVPLTSQISCPVEILHHAITFIDDFNGMTVSDPLDIGISVESDMNLDATTVVFWVNDEIAQNSPDHIFTLDTYTTQPGYYTIGAQLRDRYNQVLATAPTTFRVYVQHKLQLDITDIEREVSTGLTRMRISANPKVALPGVNVVVTSEIDPQKGYLLNNAPIPFNPDGTAELVVHDLPGTIRTLFPDMVSGDTVQIRAIVPGVSPDDYSLALSNNVTFTLAPLPPPEPKLELRLEDSLPVLSLIFFLALNLLLFRMVRLLRIRRIINTPDSYELSRQLMSITVRAEGGKQSHTLTKKTIYIGRGATNDINLGDDPNISRQHGVIMWRNQAWYYSNRKRRIKTRINGKQRKGYVFLKLEPITEIEIGGVYLIFHSNAQRDISDFITTNI